MNRRIFTSIRFALVEHEYLIQALNVTPFPRDYPTFDVILAFSSSISCEDICRRLLYDDGTINFHCSPGLSKILVATEMTKPACHEGSFPSKFYTLMCAETTFVLVVGLMKGGASESESSLAKHRLNSDALLSVTKTRLKRA